MEAKLNQPSIAKKVDVVPEHWDRLFAPSACLVTITTVDTRGRINAASFGTCARLSRSGVYRFYRRRAQGYLQ